MKILFIALALLLSGCIYSMPGDRGLFGHESEDAMNAYIKMMNARGWNPHREVSGDWFDGPRANTVLPVKYVPQLPKGCIDHGAGNGCAEINMVADTCQPYVLDYLPQEKKDCAAKHEIEGHCAGKHHRKNSMAASSCGPVASR